MKVLVFGTFDLLHDGHVFLLQEAEKRGEVTVIVARDTNVQRIKGLTTVQSEKERMFALQQRFPLFDIRLGDGNDFLAPVRAIQPDLILLGYDQKLPPGVTDRDLQNLVPHVERVPGYKPNTFKSSKKRETIEVQPL